MKLISLKKKNKQSSSVKKPFRANQPVRQLKTKETDDKEAVKEEDSTKKPCAINTPYVKKQSVRPRACKEKAVSDKVVPNNIFQSGLDMLLGRKKNARSNKGGIARSKKEEVVDLLTPCPPKGNKGGIARSKKEEVVDLLTPCPPKGNKGGIARSKKEEVVDLLTPCPPKGNKDGNSEEEAILVED